MCLKIFISISVFLFISTANSVSYAETVVTTLAGKGVSGDTNGKGTKAGFNAPSGIAVDSRGNVYVADRNQYVRKIFEGTPTTSPTITGFSPSSGPLGTQVTITGYDFPEYEHLGVIFSGVAAATSLRSHPPLPPPV